MPMALFATSTIVRVKAAMKREPSVVLTENNIEALHPGYAVDEVKAGTGGLANVAEDEVDDVGIATESSVELASTELDAADLQ